jgi:transcriptional regulator
MYNPAHFAEDRVEVLFEFIAQHPLATLVTCGADGPEATHVPVVPHPESGPHGTLRCHLARANPHADLLDGANVLAIFQGESQYITPSWYPSKREHGKVVPTWNYLVAHVRGRARIFEDSARIVEHVKALTESQERIFEMPWSVDDAPRDYIDGLSKAIVGVEIMIDSLQGKWKVSQNRPDADRAGVVEGLKGIGTEPAAEMARFVSHRGFHK